MLAPMTHPLDGARAKVAAAKDHLQTLSAEVAAFTRSHPYTTSTKFDAGESCVRVFCHISSEPPVRFSTRIGDIVHNLSSALDCAVFELARCRAGFEVGNTSFPIYGDIATYRTFRRKRSCWMQHLTVRDRALLNRLQPYRDRDESCLHPFANLYRLWNQDKHRVIVTTLAAVRQSGFTLVAARDAAGMGTVRGRLGAIEDGAEVFRIDLLIDGPDPHVKVDGDLRLEVAFEDGIPVVPALTTAVESVSVVIEELARRFP